VIKIDAELKSGADSTKLREISEQMHSILGMMELEVAAQHYN
jgi:hypothetical protein